MKTIIVEDEPKAISLLTNYVEQFSELELVATFRNGLKALTFLNTEAVDLVLLDINIPAISGLSLSKMVDQHTKIIFTTAYSEHAVESYEVHAVDYLLKPISFARFAQAITKVLASGQPGLSEKMLPAMDTLRIKSGARTYQLKVSDIDYLEKDGNYMIYHQQGQRIYTRQSTAAALAHLPDHFVQIHKSYIVNTHRIQFFDKTSLSIQARELVIGPKYREAFFTRMKD